MPRIAVDMASVISLNWGGEALIVRRRLCVGFVGFVDCVGGGNGDGSGLGRAGEGRGELEHDSPSVRSLSSSSLNSSSLSNGGEQARRNVMADIGAARLALVAVHKCRWEEVEMAKPMGEYVWYRGAWRNSHRQPNGGVLGGVHKKWSRAVVENTHRRGSVRLVVPKGQVGRRIVFGSVYAPTEATSYKEEDDSGGKSHMR